jgi:hypothetical protein
MAMLAVAYPEITEGTALEYLPLALQESSELNRWNAEGSCRESKR